MREKSKNTIYLFRKLKNQEIFGIKVDLYNFSINNIENIFIAAIELILDIRKNEPKTLEYLENIIKQVGEMVIYFKRNAPSFIIIHRSIF